MAQGIPSTQSIFGPMSRESLQLKSKMGNSLEIPGLFYSQFTPSASNVTSGTVTDNGLSLIGANQLGTTTAGTLPLGGTAAVTFSSSTGLLCSFTTSNFMPTTLIYDQMPVKFTGSGVYVLPTGILEGVVYYWQWVSGTTGKLAATPGGTVIAYTDAGSGTIYCRAATQYWGSPILPAGFFMVSDTLNAQAATSIGVAGTHIRVEIEGNTTGTTTNVTTIMPGLITAAGAWTGLTAGSALARVAAGPFPFRIAADIIVQQYGQAAITSTYANIGMIKACCKYNVYSTTTTNTSSKNLWAKTVSLDLTSQLTVDVRDIHATPVVGEYEEPVFVRMWAYN